MHCNINIDSKQLELQGREDMEDLDGVDLADVGDVVVVIVESRHGALGFISSPDSSVSGD